MADMPNISEETEYFSLEDEAGEALADEASGESVLTLELLEGAGFDVPREIILSLQNGPVTIGRVNKSGIVNDFYFNKDVKYISKTHAGFELSNGIIYVTDLESANGTGVNGVSITPGEKVRINPDDTVSFGKAHRIIYRVKQ